MYLQTSNWGNLTVVYREKDKGKLIKLYHLARYAGEIFQREILPNDEEVIYCLKHPNCKEREHVGEYRYYRTFPTGKSPHIYLLVRGEAESFFSVLEDGEMEYYTKSEALRMVPSFDGYLMRDYKKFRITTIQGETGVQ